MLVNIKSIIYGSSLVFEKKTGQEEPECPLILRVFAQDRSICRLLCVFILSIEDSFTFSCFNFKKNRFVYFLPINITCISIYKACDKSGQFYVFSPFFICRMYPQ